MSVIVGRMALGLRSRSRLPVVKAVKGVLVHEASPKPEPPVEVPEIEPSNPKAEPSESVDLAVPVPPPKPHEVKHARSHHATPHKHATTHKHASSRKHATSHHDSKKKKK